MRAKSAAPLLLLLCFATSGCYLGHVTAGQLRLLAAREPIETLLADPSTPAPLRERLGLASQARELARGLGLSVGGQYTAYVAWPGDRVVTTLVATRPGEVEPAGFWFPLLGSVPYKGYFDAARAHDEAERLRAQGLDVCEIPVPAYSTLGWLDDPLTEPMLRGGSGRIVETIVHELVHATVYLPDGAEWNEGVATFIGQEASVRWSEQTGGAELAAQERRRVEDDRAIAAALLALRQQVSELYARQPLGPERDAARAALEAQGRDAIAALGVRSRSPAALARALRLNDACLAIVGTYSSDLGGYAQLLDSLGGDLGAFVGRVRAAAALPDPREALLGRPAGQEISAPAGARPGR